MTIQPHFPKDSQRKLAWLALLTSITFAGTGPALSADLTTTSLEPSAPLENSTPETVAPIPADNPIGALLLSKQHPLLLRSDFSRVSDFIIQIYRNADYQPIWLTANHSEKNLTDLLSILNNAPNNALNPAHYDADKLKQLINQKDLDIKTTASHDLALTISLIRFLHDLRHGQVEARDVQYPLHVTPKPTLDINVLLKQHAASETLPELVDLFEPKAKQYLQLKQILQRLAPLRNQANLDEFKPGKVLHPGDKHPQIAALRQHLKAMKLLDDNSDASGKIYDAPLVAAIKQLQQQQGLKTDGVIGASTAALFNQATGEKISQIELAMERARWIPESSDGPMIVVNIPAFELWAFNSLDDPNPLNMKVIVGKAPDKQTPLLWEEMKYLEFMPYWNIPKSIYEKEILPKVANNQGYLASQEIELVRHQNSEERGGGSYLRARQRPGKKNPLGRVKFVFPNTADVYLHDTPSRAAFNRPRRDLSHGCVRVAEPEQLAEFVLSNQGDWNKETIKQAMSTPKTRHVTLKRTVPVLFYYATTFVDHTNQLRFYPDVYGQDEQLKKALNKIQAPTSTHSYANDQLVMSKTADELTHP